jgi:molecular chaperone DnaJ
MNDPYEILGVSRNATDDQVRAAYRELVKKYHPDKYQGNPLADLAEEKLREVNEAYDQIMKERSSSAGSGYQGSSGAYGNSGYGNAGGYGSGGAYSGQNAADFRTVRQYIDAGNLAAAQAKLDSIPIKNAEWIFLSGMISYRRGWYDDAVSKVDQAISMDPNNQEYRVIRMQMRRPGQMYQQQAYGQGYGNQDPFCQALQALICIDCLCPCF